jgi:two-component system sensor histidine kinase/response regulator
MFWINCYLRIVVKNVTQNIKLNLLLLTLLVGVHSYGLQSVDQDKADSLIKVMINLEESSEKVDVVNEIASVYVRIDFEKSLEYALMAEQMSKDLEYRWGEYFACKHAAFVYTTYYLNYYESINYLSRALVISEELRMTDELMSIYQSFGFVKYSMGDAEAGISYYNKAIRIAQQRSDYDGLASLYSYIAEIYKQEADEKSAFDYFSRVNSLFESGKLSSSEKPYIALGMYNRLKGDYEAAEKYYLEAIEYFSITRTPRFEAYAYSQLAETYILKGEYYKAIDATKEGLSVANALNLSKEKMDNYKVQIAIYDSLGDYKKTYTALIKYTRFKDSLNSSQFEQQNKKYQSNYERMSNENEIAQLNEEKINHELELENQQLNRNLIIGLLVFAFMLVLLMILRLRYINRKEKELKVLSLATNYTTNSIVIFDKEIKVEWVNQGFEKLTGLKLLDVKGKYFLD